MDTTGVDGLPFADERLGNRFSMVLKQLAEGTAENIPLACQDWANTKAAYRFFANERVSEADILAGHFRATRERTTTVGGTLLVLRYDGVFVSAGEHRAAPSVAQPRPQPASVIRHLNAFKPRGDASGTAARFIRGEVLDEKSVQRDQ